MLMKMDGAENDESSSRSSTFSILEKVHAASPWQPHYLPLALIRSAVSYS